MFDFLERLVAPRNHVRPDQREMRRRRGTKTFVLFLLFIPVALALTAYFHSVLPIVAMGVFIFIGYMRTWYF